jgi:hypothetical protein
MSASELISTIAWHDIYFCVRVHYSDKIERPWLSRRVYSGLTDKQKREFRAHARKVTNMRRQDYADVLKRMPDIAAVFGGAR